MIELIEKYICLKEGIDPELLHKVNSKGKLFQKRELVDCRQIVMHYAYENKYTFANAGRYYGQDHATVMNGRGKISDLRDSDKSFREKMDKYDKCLLGLYKYSIKEITAKLEMNIPEKIKYLKEVLVIFDDDIDKLEEKLDNIISLRDDLAESIQIYKEKLLKGIEQM